MRRTTKLRPPFRLKYPGWAWVASSHARTRLGGATVTGTAQRYSGDGVARGFGATHGVGSSDAITLAETLSPAATTLIIKYRCNGAGGGGFGRLLQKGTSTNGEQSLIVSTATGSPRLIWLRTNNAGTVLFSGFVTDNSITDGLFHTLVLASDGTVSAPIAYQDGVQQTYVYQSPSTTNTANNTDPFRIGNRPSDSARVWDGLIESVVCLDLALPSAELRAISLDPSLVFRSAPEFSIFVSPGAAPTGGAALGEQSPSGSVAAIKIGSASANGESSAVGAVAAAKIGNVVSGGDSSGHGSAVGGTTIEITRIQGGGVGSSSGGKKRREIVVVEIDGIEYRVPVDHLSDFLAAHTKEEKKPPEKKKRRKGKPVIKAPEYVAPVVVVKDAPVDLLPKIDAEIERTNEKIRAIWMAAMVRYQQEIDDEEALVCLLAA